MSSNATPRQHRPGPPETAPNPGDAPNPAGERKRHQDKLVDEAVDESFPASDPPSYTPTDTSGSDSKNEQRNGSARKARRRDPEAEATAELEEERELAREAGHPPLPRGAGDATADQLRDAIDSGATGDKVPVRDPAAAPLGTDEEAAGTTLQSAELTEALERETSRAAVHGATPEGQAARERPRPYWQRLWGLFTR